MLAEFENYLTFENIYLWTNFGVLPFWFMLIVIPYSKVTNFFINSIILPLILATVYTHIIYQAIISDDSILDVFKLYFNLDNLYTVFATESFLLIFWLHFVALNIFLGSWMCKDGLRYNINRAIMFFPLMLVYFSGPLGLVLYWLIRIFYAKRLSFHD